MDRPSFQQFCDQVRVLPREQLAQLLEVGLALIHRPDAAAVIETARAPVLRCPRCAGHKLYRDGSASGLQRFRCCACGRTFNSLTGTPLAHLRLKNKWLAYCDTLLDPGSTVRGAAQDLGVHRTTSFRWRHRLLAWVKHDLQTPLRGIVEADEMYLLESQKGSRKMTRAPRKRGGHACKRGISQEQVCVLVARDREGRTHDAVTGTGPPTAAKLVEHLKPALDKDVLLVTDSHAAYRSFAHRHGIHHVRINVRLGQHARGAIHVQNVNSYHSRFRGWLLHFRGIATRYLDNYCGWRRALDGQHINSPEAFLRAAVGVFRK